MEQQFGNLYKSKQSIIKREKNELYETGHQSEHFPFNT